MATGKDRMGNKSVLFICLGNICRSPIAEAVFRHKVKERGLTDQWEIDSAAIGDWHIGLKADKRTHKCLKSHGLSSDHVVRQITDNDFRKFDVIFGMDDSNMSDLNDLKPLNCTAQLKRLGEYDPKKELTVEDPYYERDDSAFEEVYVQCERCCEQFLDEMSS